MLIKISILIDDLQCRKRNPLVKRCSLGLPWLTRTPGQTHRWTSWSVWSPVGCNEIMKDHMGKIETGASAMHRGIVSRRLRYLRDIRGEEGRGHIQVMILTLMLVIVVGNQLIDWWRHFRGLVTLKKSLNYEERSSYNLVVEAQDAGDNILSSTASIFVQVSGNMAVQKCSWKWWLSNRWRMSRIRSLSSWMPPTLTLWRRAHQREQKSSQFRWHLIARVIHAMTVHHL